MDNVFEKSGEPLENKSSTRNRNNYSQSNSQRKKKRVPTPTFGRIEPALICYKLNQHPTLPIHSTRFGSVRIDSLQDVLARLYPNASKIGIRLPGLMQDSTAKSKYFPLRNLIFARQEEEGMQICLTEDNCTPTSWTPSSVALANHI